MLANRPLPPIPQHLPATPVRPSDDNDLTRLAAELDYGDSNDISPEADQHSFSQRDADITPPDLRTHTFRPPPRLPALSRQSDPDIIAEEATPAPPLRANKLTLPLMPTSLNTVADIQKDSLKLLNGHARPKIGTL